MPDGFNTEVTKRAGAIEQRMMAPLNRSPVIGLLLVVEVSDTGDVWGVPVLLCR